MAARKKITEVANSTPRRKRRKEARPGEIIEAGLLEFAKNGYAATRLDDVAKRAGVAKGTIYRYFDDKQALFLAAVQSIATTTFDPLDRFVDEFEGSTQDLLTELFRVVHMKLLHSDLKILMRIVITEGRNFPELSELYYKESISKGQAILKRIIDRGIAANEIRTGALTDLPIVILAPAIMAAIWQMTFEKQQFIEPERFFAAHLDLVFNGLMKARP